MNQDSRRQQRDRIILIVVVGLFCLLPAVAYWVVVGRAPTVTPGEARNALEQTGSKAILVDVCTPEEYTTRHLDGSYHWPLDQILALPPQAALPSALQHKDLYLICRTGVRSAQAAQKLSEHPVQAVYSVQGGLQAWAKAVRTPCPLPMSKLKHADGQLEALPYRESSLLEQWAITLTAFSVKPLYMLLAFALILVLRRTTARDLLALKWAMIAFLLGEGFCALNFLFFAEDSALMEYLHGLGMVLAFGFTTFAVLEGVDQRLLRVSVPDKRCAVLSLCTACIKKDPAAPCTARRLTLYFLALCPIICFMPLTVTIRDVAYNTTILGTPYTHAHSTMFQLFEFRYAPLVAMLLYLASLLVLRFRADDPVPLSKWLFAHGTGFLSFGFFRMIVYSAYIERMGWYATWEELLELLYIVAVSIVLWLFRHRLLTGSQHLESSTPATS